MQQGTSRIGIVIAGGRGERLGMGVPKALVTVAGRTLLDRACDLLRDCGVERLRVVVPGTMALPALAPDTVRVDDPPGDGGPLGGLVAGLGAEAFDEALVVPVDQPLLRPATLLALAAQRGNATAAVTARDGRLQPLVGAYGPGAVAALRASWDRGERAVHRAVRSAGARVLEGDDAPGLPEEWTDLDTPADLVEVERRLAQGACA